MSTMDVSTYTMLTKIRLADQLKDNSTLDRLCFRLSKQLEREGYVRDTCRAANRVCELVEQAVASSEIDPFLIDPCLKYLQKLGWPILGELRTDSLLVLGPHNMTPSIRARSRLGSPLSSLTTGVNIENDYCNNNNNNLPSCSRFLRRPSGSRIGMGSSIPISMNDSFAVYSKSIAGVGTGAPKRRNGKVQRHIARVRNGRAQRRRTRVQLCRGTRWRHSDAYASRYRRTPLFRFQSQSKRRVQHRVSRVPMQMQLPRAIRPPAEPTEPVSVSDRTDLLLERIKWLTDRYEAVSAQCLLRRMRYWGKKMRKLRPMRHRMHKERHRVLREDDWVVRWRWRDNDGDATAVRKVAVSHVREDEDVAEEEDGDVAEDQDVSSLTVVSEGEVSPAVSVSDDSSPVVLSERDVSSPAVSVSDDRDSSTTVVLSDDQDSSPVVVSDDRDSSSPVVLSDDREDSPTVVVSEDRLRVNVTSLGGGRDEFTFAPSQTTAALYAEIRSRYALCEICLLKNGRKIPEESTILVLDVLEDGDRIIACPLLRGGSEQRIHPTRRRHLAAHGKAPDSDVVPSSRYSLGRGRGGVEARAQAVVRREFPLTAGSGAASSASRMNPPPPSQFADQRPPDGRGSGSGGGPRPPAAFGPNSGGRGGPPSMNSVRTQPRLASPHRRPPPPGGRGSPRRRPPPGAGGRGSPRRVPGRAGAHPTTPAGANVGGRGRGGGGGGLPLPPPPGAMTNHGWRGAPSPPMHPAPPAQGPMFVGGGFGGGLPGQRPMFAGRGGGGGGGPPMHPAPPAQGPMFAGRGGGGLPPPPPGAVTNYGAPSPPMHPGRAPGAPPGAVPGAPIAVGGGDNLAQLLESALTTIKALVTANPQRSQRLHDQRVLQRTTSSLNDRRVMSRLEKMRNQGFFRGRAARDRGLRGVDPELQQTRASIGSAFRDGGFEEQMRLSNKDESEFESTTDALVRTTMLHFLFWIAEGKKRDELLRAENVGVPSSEADEDGDESMAAALSDSMLLTESGIVDKNVTDRADPRCPDFEIGRVLTQQHFVAFIYFLRSQYFSSNVVSNKASALLYVHEATLLQIVEDVFRAVCRALLRSKHIFGVPGKRVICLPLEFALQAVSCVRERKTKLFLLIMIWSALRPVATYYMGGVVYLALRDSAFRPCLLPPGPPNSVLKWARGPMGGGFDVWIWVRKDKDHKPRAVEISTIPVLEYDIAELILTLAILQDAEITLFRYNVALRIDFGLSPSTGMFGALTKSAFAGVCRHSLEELRGGLETIGIPEAARKRVVLKSTRRMLLTLLKKIGPDELRAAQETLGQLEGSLSHHHYTHRMSGVDVVRMALRIDDKEEELNVEMKTLQTRETLIAHVARLSKIALGEYGTVYLEFLSGGDSPAVPEGDTEPSTKVELKRKMVATTTKMRRSHVKLPRTLEEVRKLDLEDFEGITDSAFVKRLWIKTVVTTRLRPQYDHFCRTGVVAYSEQDLQKPSPSSPNPGASSPILAASESLNPFRVASYEKRLQQIRGDRNTTTAQKTDLIRLAQRYYPCLFLVEWWALCEKEFILHHQTADAPMLDVSSAPADPTTAPATTTSPAAPAAPAAPTTASATTTAPGVAPTAASAVMDVEDSIVGDCPRSELMEFAMRLVSVRDKVMALLRVTVEERDENLARRGVYRVHRYWRLILSSCDLEDLDAPPGALGIPVNGILRSFGTSHLAFFTCTGPRKWSLNLSLAEPSICTEVSLMRAKIRSEVGCKLPNKTEVVRAVELYRTSLTGAQRTIPRILSQPVKWGDRLSSFRIKLGNCTATTAKLSLGGSLKAPPKAIVCCFKLDAFPSLVDAEVTFEGITRDGVRIFSATKSFQHPFHPESLFQLRRYGVCFSKLAFWLLDDAAKEGHRHNELNLFRYFRGTLSTDAMLAMQKLRKYVSNRHPVFLQMLDLGRPSICEVVSAEAFQIVTTCFAYSKTACEIVRRRTEVNGTQIFGEIHVPRYDPRCNVDLLVDEIPSKDSGIAFFRSLVGTVFVAQGAALLVPGVFYDGARSRAWPWVDPENETILDFCAHSPPAKLYRALGWMNSGAKAMFSATRIALRRCNFCLLHDVRVQDCTCDVDDDGGSEGNWIVRGRRLCSLSDCLLRVQRMIRKLEDSRDIRLDPSSAVKLGDRGKWIDAVLLPIGDQAKVRELIRLGKTHLVELQREIASASSPSPRKRSRQRMESQPQAPAMSAEQIARVQETIVAGHASGAGRTGIVSGRIAPLHIVGRHRSRQKELREDEDGDDVMEEEEG